MIDRSNWTRKLIYLLLPPLLPGSALFVFLGQLALVPWTAFHSPSKLPLLPVWRQHVWEISSGARQCHMWISPSLNPSPRYTPHGLPTISLPEVNRKHVFLKKNNVMLSVLLWEIKNMSDQKNTYSWIFSWIGQTFATILDLHCLVWGDFAPLPFFS